MRAKSGHGTCRWRERLAGAGTGVFVVLGEAGPVAGPAVVLAFALVNVAVLVLRRSRPDLKRAFRMPGAPVPLVLGVLARTYLRFSMSLSVWISFGVWLLLGLAIYFGYGMRRSALETEEMAQASA